MRWILLILVCMVLPVAAAVAQKTDTAPTLDIPNVHLATNLSSAFTSDFDSDSAQDLSPHLHCIFKKMERKYSVQVMPWRRAYQDVKSNRIDGFFTAVPMGQVDSYAVLSAPLVLENWYWFWRTDTAAPKSWREGYKVGSILGSQQETWLSDAGYKVEMSANNLPQLIKLLKSKRIDVILADRDHFVRAANELHIDPDHFEARFFRYVPLGVYFNRVFLTKNKGFLAGFNHNITACTTARFALSNYEQQEIKNLLGSKIERWKRLPKLHAILAERNAQSRGLAVGEIVDRDKLWMHAFRENDDSYAMTLLDKALSARLSDIKKQTQHMITEIIITDARGLNVAISDMTSDYWQGDEEKFTDVFGKPANTLHLGEISYDESTKRFQVQLSVPLYDVKKITPLGVMVFGVDVEKALAETQ